MKTVPIEKPAVGMIIANQKQKLYASITSVSNDGFKFWVHNGEWAGRVSGNQMKIIETGNVIEISPFEKIVGLSQEEAQACYLIGEHGGGVKGIRRLILAGDHDDAEGRLSQADPYGKDVDRAAHALSYIESRGLTGKLNVHIEAILIADMDAAHQVRKELAPDEANSHDQDRSEEPSP